MRKRQIFIAVNNIISEKGLSALTTTEIAKRVGISQPAIYKHFKNKDEILLYFIGEIRKELEKIIKKANSGKNFFEKIENLYNAHFKFVTETKVMPRIVFSDEIHGIENYDKKIKFRKECFDFYKNEIEKIFKNCEIKKIDEKICAEIIIGTFMSVSLKWMLYDMKYPLEKEIPPLMEFWKNYIKNF